MKIQYFLFLLLGAFCCLRAQAQDPDIDRLLKKLPPPEKLAQARSAPGMPSNDPAFKDPIAQELDKAMRAGQAARGLELARNLSVRYPKSVFAHFLRGACALAGRQFGEASRAFRQTIEMEPRFTQGYVALAVAEGGQGRWEAALSQLKKAAQLQPQAADIWILESACLERMGRKEESVRAARRGTELAPKAAAAWAQLARVESALGHRAEALLAVGKAVRLSPNATMVSPTRVNALNLNRPVEAVRILRRATQLEPKNSLLQKQLRDFEQLVAQTNQSLVRLRQNTEAHPQSGAAWQQLGLAYQKLERHREAADAFEKAARLGRAAGSEKNGSHARALQKKRMRASL